MCKYTMIVFHFYSFSFKVPNDTRHIEERKADFDVICKKYHAVEVRLRSTRERKDVWSEIKSQLKDYNK